MSDRTPILSLPEVSPYQTQKEATINTAFAIVEAAMNESIGISLAAGDVTLNTDQFTRAFFQQYVGHSATRTVTVPSTQRWFAAENMGTGTITFQVQSPGYGTTVDLAAGKIALIVSDGQDLRFVVPDAGSGVGLLEDLSDVAGGATDGQLLRYYTADSEWKPWTLVLAFSQLSDFPGAYGSNASKLLAVKADGTGLEWVSSSANVNSFTDLDDAPSSYSGAAGRTVKVNTGGTALIFAQPKLTEASDFPANYTGAANKWARVNSGATALTFDTIDLADITDGPGAPGSGTPLQYLRINAAGNALEYASGTGGPDHFYQLADVPSSYTGQAGKYTRVNATEDGLEYHQPTFVELSDTPANFTGAGGKFAQVNSGATALQFGLPKVSDLSDGPGAFSSNSLKVVRVNLGETALEYRTLAITDLSGFPNSFTGQGGKFLQVNAGGTGVQFVSSSYTTNFLALTDTPSAYTGAANKFVVVDPTATGLIFKSVVVPVKLGDLADVEDGTGTPAAGSYLRWIDGVWQAETGGASTFTGLSDVPASYTSDGNKAVTVKSDETGLEFSDRIADIGVFIPGQPNAGEICVRYVVASGFDVLATGHQASADTAATGSTVFTFSKNGVSIGTATFAASGTTATFSITATSFAAGDVYAITAPGSQDSTISDISFTLRANRN